MTGIKEEEEDKLIKIDIIYSETIIKYLKKMKISLFVAKKECKEILFRYKGKEHNVLAFNNNSGWYEVRNDYINGHIGTKDISYVRCRDDNIAITCCVFEDFIDYLSFLTIQSYSNSHFIKKQDYLILNSFSCLDNVFLILEKYDNIYCFFNNDATGSNTIHRIILKLGINKVHDASIYYKGYKNVSDFLTNKHIFQNKMEVIPKKGRRR